MRGLGGFLAAAALLAPHPTLGTETPSPSDVVTDSLRTRALGFVSSDPRTPLQLFAAVEDAWGRSDADRLASLVDTTRVRIALKPGDAPTAATTRSAAAFLFQDRLRLVATESFRVVRFEFGKQGRCRAVARWSADWGGRQGARDVDVLLGAEASGSLWLLTEVRAED